jgi:predicted nucleic acid-binding protein
MVIGADTGFLLEYARGNERAVMYWNAARSGEDQIVISVVSIAEYLAYQIQRGMLETAEGLVETIKAIPNFEIAALDLETASLSARYRRGMNLATVDSLIFATALRRNCELLLTMDSVFAQASVESLIAVELL